MSLMKYLSPKLPKEERFNYAKGGFAPDDPLGYGDRLTVFFVFMHDADADLKNAATRSFEEASNEHIMEALQAPLEPLVIRKILELKKNHETFMVMAALNPIVDDALVEYIGENCNDDTACILAADPNWLVEKPVFLTGLKKNQLISKLTVERVESGEIYKEAAEYTTDQEMAEQAADASGSSMLTPEEEAQIKADLEKAIAAPKGNPNSDEKNIFKMVKSLTVSQKVKLAMSGNKSARELLIKESNKMVSRSVLKNPRISEDEVLRLCQTRGTPEELLREVARNRAWQENYSIKLACTTNSKTPLPVAMKMLSTLNSSDLQKLSKSKNITSALSGAARRMLETSKKH